MLGDPPVDPVAEPPPHLLGDARVGVVVDERLHLRAEGVGALREVFRSTTIADIASREASEAGAGMYYI